MSASVIGSILSAVNDIAKTAIAFYFIYSLRVYLTARLEHFGAEAPLTKKEMVHEFEN